MSLPSVGVTVSAVIHDWDDMDPVAVIGNVVAGRNWGIDETVDPHILWEPVTRDFRITLMGREEGVTWARGSSVEVRAALLAAYALAGGRGANALSGEP